MLYQDITIVDDSPATIDRLTRIIMSAYINKGIPLESIIICAKTSQGDIVITALEFIEVYIKK